MLVISTSVNGRNVPAKTSMKAGDGLCCSPLTVSTMTQREAEAVAPILGALADPVRLRLFSILASEGEVCSCNLEGPLGKSQPTISHHTRILAEAGLIAGERRGKWTWWRVVPERLADLRRMLGGR
jgi:ArsR family transcriptional regulator, arsenate/arsenite/antimonite-responsive transcriptional repressor